MNGKQGQIVYRSLHAPKANGAALIEPPMAEFANQVAAYFRTPPSGTRVCFGAKSQLLHRIEARVEFFRLMVEDSRINAPMVMVGHQPQFFHPGVWMKNFVASRLANRVGGTAINLVVDNDLMKSASIVVPSREGEGSTAQVAFDASAEEMPYEERESVEPDLLDSFVARVVQAMPTVDWKPLIAEHWPSFAAVWKSMNPDANIGRKFSAFRQTMESYWGFPTFDLPLSVAITTRAFAQLVLEMIQDAREFAEIYNGCLAQYREVHGLRSRSHPASDLEIVSDAEIELPFWLWTTSAPRRKRAFVRRNGDTFTVTDRDGIEWSANLSEGDALVDRMVDELLMPTAAFEPNRPKLRPKALITTLYARYLLCDGFVHGVGGAKYDQVTEAIAARWGLGTLAPMQCATMTLRLPMAMDVVSEEEVRKRKRVLRDIVCHPEKFIGETELSPQDRARADELIAEKRKWITESAAERLPARHRAIQTINAELGTMLGAVRARYEAEYVDAHSTFTRQQPWLSREFPAVLFPQEMLKSEFERVTCH
jgi:hypothetical protein